MDFSKGINARYPRERQCYWGMRTRCYNTNHRYYCNYGGRGITVCDRWLDKGGFKKFLEDMGEKPEGHTLDRINADGPYSPENCRWATIDIQANNKRSNIRITIGEETKTLSEWAKFYNIRQGTVFTRYYRGWRGEKLFSPIHSV